MNNLIKKFEEEKDRNIKRMSSDKKLMKLSLNFYSAFSKHNYQYNFTWLGRPIIQLPQDIIAMQEIIWQVKPDLIIETGIAHGGSIIFSASMLELIGKGKVVGIDIDIRKHNLIEIQKSKMYKRIKLIEGSSIDKAIVNQVEKIVKKHKKVMVFLDSLHTHDHVLKELEIYSKFVSTGSYIVVFDSIIESMSQDFAKNRPWSRGDNPATAINAFMKRNKNFMDVKLENKLLLTAAPKGYLKRIR